MRRTRTAAITLALSLSLPVLVQAQQRAASITYLVDTSGRKPSRIESVTDKVQIRRRQSPEWVPAAPQDVIWYQDWIRLKEFVRAEIAIRNRDQRGNFVLFTTNTLETQRGEATYEMREDLEEVGQMALHVRNGSAVIDWFKGRLLVIASGVKALMNGTRIAVVVGAEDGTIYLESGSLTFPDHPQITVAPGEGVRLRQGRPPRKVVLDRYAAAQFEDLIETNTRIVSVRPLWKRVAVYSGVGVAVGTAAWVTISMIKDDDPVQGQVLIQIPR